MTANTDHGTEPSFSVDALARAEDCSRATLYNLWAIGKGPRFYFVGKQRRITAKARAEWHRQLEAEACGEAA